MAELTYSETIYKLLKGKMVEIHTGDTRTVHNYSEMDLVKKSVLRGVVVNALNDVLVLDCLTLSKGKTQAYVNGYSIRVITEYEPFKNIVDIFHDEDSKDR